MAQVTAVIRSRRFFWSVKSVAPQDFCLVFVDKKDGLCLSKPEFGIHITKN